MKTIFSLLLVALLSVLLSGCITTLMLSAAADANLQCLSDPSDNLKPPRIRGEFPFRLIYEKSGVQTAIEDTQLCRLKGRTCTIYGRDQIFKSTLASGKKKIVLHQVDQDQAYLASLGSCADMMAQPHYRRIIDDPEYPGSLAKYKNGRITETRGGIWVKSELGKLGVRVVKFEQRSANGPADGP